MSEEVRDNMRIVWDAPIEMCDGIVLRADVFRPVGESTIPAILSYGPYAKGMSFAESRPFAWQRLIKTHSCGDGGHKQQISGLGAARSGDWVKDGYAIVRVDARGGRPLAGLYGSLVAARDPRHLRMLSMVGSPAVV
jgi:predicted acyl esterase